MLRQNLLNRINECLARFFAEVKGSTATGLTDINRHAEEVLVPLFREVFELSNLRNLNMTDGANFPAIDLADDTARVAFQVTASPEGRKVIDTLKTFLRHNLQTKYDRLIIYILTERKKEYSEDGISKLVAGRMDFSCKRDILDSRDLLKVLAGRPDSSLKQACAVLEREFGGQNPFGKSDPLAKLELLPNLVEVYRRREAYDSLEYSQLEPLVKESLLRDFPLLYWCGKHKGDVLAVLEQLFTHMGFECRSGACHLWVVLQDCSAKSHLKRMNELHLGRILDRPWQIERDRNPASLEDYVRLGLPDRTLVEAMASHSDTATVRELGVFAEHRDKVVRRTLAFCLCKQHNFASVDLLIKLLEDGDIGVQFEALRSLAYIGTGCKDEWVLHYMLVDDEPLSARHIYDLESLAIDCKYRRVFPKGISSNWTYLHHKLIVGSDSKKDRFAEGSVGVLAVCGGKEDLDLLLSLYVLGLERWPESVRLECKRALNLIDERLYQETAIGKDFRNAPNFGNRWWQHRRIEIAE